MPAWGLDYETKTSGAAVTVETASATINYSLNFVRSMTIALSESIPPPAIIGIV